MPPADFMLTFDPSQKYMALIDQLEKDRKHAEDQGRILTEKDWKRHWKLMEDEFGRMYGLKKAKRHPSLEALFGPRTKGNTPVPNQDHASIWNKNNWPVMLVSMPNTKAPARQNEQQVGDFEERYDVKCERMSFPGWYNPPATALDVWMLTRNRR